MIALGRHVHIATAWYVPSYARAARARPRQSPLLAITKPTIHRRLTPSRIHLIDGIGEPETVHGRGGGNAGMESSCDHHSGEKLLIVINGLIAAIRVFAFRLTSIVKYMDRFMNAINCPVN